MYKIVLTKSALQKLEFIKSSGLKDKLVALINLIKENPYQTHPTYEKLVGDFKGLYYRRINLKHRLVYEVLEDEKIIKIVSVWSHYESVKK